MELPPEIAAKYRAVRILGEGGFGTVYEAIHLETNRPVALKVLADKALVDADAVARFRHEALVASEIRHPGVVHVLDYGIDGDHGYIALPLIVGCTLRDRIRQGPLPTGAAVLIGIGLADALAEIHRVGVLHRDLKPENVLLENRERPLLTDFGISKSAGSSVQTREGIIFGTPGYVAPEQLEHEKASPASDQFSLGVILFEMLAGRRPYSGETPAEEAMARIKHPPMGIRSLVPRLDAGVADVVMRMLSRKPGDRYKDMLAAHRALQVAMLKMPVAEKDQVAVQQPGRASNPRLADETPVPRRGSRSMGAVSPATQQMSSRVQRAATPPKRELPLKAIGGAALGIGVLAMAVLFLTRSAETPSPPPPPVVERRAEPAAVQVPAQFPRIAVPDCATLEGAGGRPTPLDVARCEVRRWLDAWAKQGGNPGAMLARVEAANTPKDAQALLELFESAPATRAMRALEHLRGATECPAAERFDAGLLALKARTAHAACLWKAFGGSLPKGEPFPSPMLFLAAAADFHAQWNEQWKLAQAAGWEEQAGVLGEWLAFHRALEEKRLDLGETFSANAVRDSLRDPGLTKSDPALLLARISRARIRGEPLQALLVWKQTNAALASAELPAGKAATLKAWSGLEGCLLSLLAKDLPGAMRSASEAKAALAAAADDPGARKLGLAGWPEWKQISGLAR